MSTSQFLVLWLTSFAFILACRVVPVVALRGRPLSPRVVEALGRGGVSEARSRMLDRQVLALAQADPGSAKTWSELQRLASKGKTLALRLASGVGLGGLLH